MKQRLVVSIAVWGASRTGRSALITATQAVLLAAVYQSSGPGSATFAESARQLGGVLALMLVAAIVLVEICGRCSDYCKKLEARGIVEKDPLSGNYLHCR